MNTATMTIRVTQEEKDLMKRYAKSQRSSTAAMARKAILDFIEDQNDIARLDRAVAEQKASREPMLSHAEVMSELGFA